MKKYIFAVLAVISMISCQRERVNVAKSLEGRALVVYSIQSMQNYINVNQNFGKSVLVMDFSQNKGLGFLPDTTVNQWHRELGDTQKVRFSTRSTGRDMVEINFPLPNEDLVIEKFPVRTSIPTSEISGVYSIEYGFLPGTGQKGWILTKYDRYGPRGQAGQPLVTIQLLDR